MPKPKELSSPNQIGDEGAVAPRRRLGRRAAGARDLGSAATSFQTAEDV